jgi:hypothetical protein
MTGGNPTVAAIVEFIETIEPGFSQRIRGASSDVIDQLQSQCTAPLPRAYVEFLELLGERSGDFDVFPDHAYAASALIQQWPGRDHVTYPVNRYFRIALNVADEPVARLDYFLDMDHRSEDDAPLVKFEIPSDEPGETQKAKASSFHCELRDWLLFQAFHSYALMPLKHRVRLIVDPYSNVELNESFARLQRFLIERGAAVPLEASPRTWCGTLGDCAMVARQSEMSRVALMIGSKNEKSLVRLSEVLGDNLDVITLMKGRYF